MNMLLKLLHLIPGFHFYTDYVPISLKQDGEECEQGKCLYCNKTDIRCEMDGVW